MQFQSSSLNTNARMYLYDTPRDTMAKDPMLNINMEGSKAYAQHFQLSFHVFQSFSLNTKVSTHVLQSFSLITNNQSHKFSRAPRSTQTLITYVLQISSLNTKHQSPMFSKAPLSTQNISSIMCFRVHA